VAAGTPAFPYPCVTFSDQVWRSSVTNNRFRCDHPAGYVQGSVSTGNRFHNNILNANVAVDEYRIQSIGGPAQTPLGITSRNQQYGTGSIDSGRTVGRYSADTSNATEILYKSRATTVGGTRVAVASGDGVYQRRYGVDDGTADVEVARELVQVDGVTGGRWVFYTKSAAGTLTQRFIIDNAGNIVTGVAALATTATDGFLYIPSGAGAPTGVPTSKTGQVPLYVNTTANKLMFYSGGAWRDAGP
jgi:hypothetical protein